MALVVATRALGRRKALLDDFGVPPPAARPGGDDLRLRDVIEHVVCHEVCEFERRQQHRRFDRVLSESKIANDAARGKVDPAAKHYSQQVDTDSAVANALQGFEDGLYLVIIDNVERRSLDEIVHMTSDSRLVFLRLAFLAGA